ncbi:MAG: tRNA pseudouridine(38-40) synthase TruA [Candidatus Thermoplasmatota archaeon]
MRVALKFAYDGKKFSGYARQPGQRTIEQTLIERLMKQGIFDDARNACFRTASRTDRGVSALGNVCAFDTHLTKEEILHLLKTQTAELFIYGAQEVSAGYYPRHAKRREYRYYLRKAGLDMEKVLSAANIFTGEHNFQNFARVEPLKNPVRYIENIIVCTTRDFFVLDFYAQTFLWNQIRRIVSALKKVGDGTQCLDAIRYALDHPEKKIDFQLAAAEPLLLKDVVYDFSFDHIRKYKEKLLSFERSIVSSLK